jgi:hypothetical protein
MRRILNGEGALAPPYCVLLRRVYLEDIPVGVLASEALAASLKKGVVTGAPIDQAQRARNKLDATLSRARKALKIAMFELLEVERSGRAR